jgi:signal transduction histidine kinase
VEFSSLSVSPVLFPNMGANMPVMTQAIALVTGLTDATHRSEAAHALASYLGAEDLLLFMWDADRQSLILAPGFPQTLPHFEAWRSFLTQCAKSDQCSAILPYPIVTESRRVFAYTADNGGIVLVLLGGTKISTEIFSVIALLPLLAASLRGEQATRLASQIVKQARETVEEAKTLTDSLKDVQAELHRMELQKADFLNIVSHELKTPLTTMKGMAQLTRRKLERAGVEDAKYLAVMERSTDRMERLINDLLDISRIEAGKLILRWECCNLIELCEQAAEEEAAAWHRPIDLELPDQPVMVELDAERIRQVMLNLLSNAFKYSLPEQRVTLKLSQEDDSALVSIHDHGTGIPSEALPHLFERFFRVTDTPVQAGSQVGMGVGLYICQTIIERHHGQIGVRSEPGQGSTFWFKLPRSQGGA